MELTVYRQASKQRPDGTIVYKGEDARPYAGDHLLLVADGLGGASAIRHQKINPDMFDKDKLLGVLFKGVYDDYSDERFVKYVTDSFFELFAVKDCYTDNFYNIKKGGYFGSRLVCAIVLHEAIYDERMNPDALFGALASAKEEDGIKRLQNELSDLFTGIVGRDLAKIAKKCNLIYESSINGMALLGTTLCATFFKETDVTVETAYLTAGDSRPYVWTERNGLQQLVRDEERPDGGMTNYIKANEGSSFRISCRCMSFPKPCILFNASDGCFDSDAFLSPMAFEKLILETFASSDGMSEAEKKLYDFFAEWGRHDDSSTIAMKTFGFDSFEALQKSAAERLKQLDAQYLSRLPELLDHDYAAEVREADKKLGSLVADIKAKLDGRPEVEEHCLQMMKKENYAPFADAMRAIDGRIGDERRQIEQSGEAIGKLISRNYVRFRPYLDGAAGFLERLAERKIEKGAIQRESEAEEFALRLGRFRSDFLDAAKKLEELIGQIGERVVPSDPKDYDDAGIEVLNECEAALKSLENLIDSSRKERIRTVALLGKLKDEYVNGNEKLASRDADGFQSIKDRLISGKIDPSAPELRLLKDEKAVLVQETEKTRELLSEISRLDGSERNARENECRDRFWNENCADVVVSIASETPPSLPEELQAQVRAVAEKVALHKGELKKSAQLQESLFAEYDGLYGRIMEENGS